MPAGHIEIFIDACASGGLITPVTEAVFPPGVTLLGGTSTDSIEDSNMVDDHFANYGLDWWGVLDFGSEWTKSFADGLRSGLDGADTDGDGFISASEWEAVERSSRDAANSAVPDQKPQTIN